MRKIVFSSGILLGITLCLLSCQREVDDIFNQPTTPADSTYLQRVITLDTTRPPGMDTAENAYFFYDSQKRLIRFYFYNPGTLDTVIHYYSYNGTDTLPYLEAQKSINYSGPGTIYYDSVFYTYNNGLVKKDSVISWEFPGAVNRGVIVSDFSVTGNTVARRDRYYSLVAGIYQLTSIDSGFYTVSYSGSNLASQQLTSGNGYFDDVQATYDTKPNPLHKAFKTRYPNFEGYFIDNWGVQVNNFLQVQWQNSINPTITEITAYRYRADGYPTQAIYFDSGGFSSYNKILYYYTSL